MPLPSSEQLKQQISDIPNTLREALERQAKARIDVARLELQISKLEDEIERENAQNDDDDNEVSEYDDLEDDVELIKLETNVERLKLQVTEAEDKAEIQFRASTAKATESHVKAAVGIDPTVIKLRHKYLDTKEAARERKVTLQRERQAAREAKLAAKYNSNHVSKADVSHENEKLLALQTKLAEAEERVALADVEVEVARAMIETYKMLVHLS